MSVSGWLTPRCQSFDALKPLATICMQACLLSSHRPCPSGWLDGHAFLPIPFGSFSHPLHNMVGIPSRFKPPTWMKEPDISNVKKTTKRPSPTAFKKAKPVSFTSPPDPSFDLLQAIHDWLFKERTEEKSERIWRDGQAQSKVFGTWDRHNIEAEIENRIDDVMLMGIHDSLVLNEVDLVLLKERRRRMTRPPRQTVLLSLQPESS